MTNSAPKTDSMPGQDSTGSSTPINGPALRTVPGQQSTQGPRHYFTDLNSRNYQAPRPSGPLTKTWRNRDVARTLFDGRPDEAHTRCRPGAGARDGAGRT